MKLNLVCFFLFCYENELNDRTIVRTFRTPLVFYKFKEHLVIPPPTDYGGVTEGDTSKLVMPPPTDYGGVTEGDTTKLVMPPPTDYGGVTEGSEAFTRHLSS